MITGVILIGVSPILIKMADAPGIVSSFYRMAIGAIVLAVPFAVNRRKKRSGFSVKGAWFAILGGICFALDMAMWSTGIVASNATLPTIVANLAPIWVGLGAMLFFKEKQRPVFWAGLAIALVGMSLLVSDDLFKSNTIILKGIFLGLSAGIFYAFYQLLTQAGRRSLDTISYLFISTLSASVILGTLILVLGHKFTGYSDRTWLIFATIGIGIQAGAWFLLNYALGYIPASVVSPSLLLQPVLTGVIAVSFLNEKLTSWHISGGIVVLTGIYMVHHFKNIRPKQ
jgi:drug/metabolite transporter (DMT)-like permease